MNLCKGSSVIVDLNFPFRRGSAAAMLLLLPPPARQQVRASGYATIVCAATHNTDAGIAFPPGHLPCQNQPLNSICQRQQTSSSSSSSSSSSFSSPCFQKYEDNSVVAVMYWVVYTFHIALLLSPSKAPSLFHGGARIQVSQKKFS